VVYSTVTKKFYSSLGFFNALKNRINRRQKLIRLLESCTCESAFDVPKKVEVARCQVR
jgi:hypothetical protein